MNGKSALGVMLVIVGAFAVLSFLNINFGAILGMLLPFILIGFGVLGWMNNKKIIGGILIVIGAISLMGKLSGIFTLLLAIGLIVGGIALFKKGNHRTY